MIRKNYDILEKTLAVIYITCIVNKGVLAFLSFFAGVPENGF
jgi:hypothetical protein